METNHWNSGAKRNGGVLVRQQRRRPGGASDNLAPTDRVDMRRTELVNEFTEIVEDW